MIDDVEGVAVPDTVGVSDTVTLMDDVSDTVGETVRVDDTVGVPLRVAVTVTLPLRVVVTVTLLDREAVELKDSVRVTVGVVDVEAPFVGEPEGVRDQLTVTVALLEAVPLVVLERVAEKDFDTVADDEDVTDCV